MSEYKVVVDKSTVPVGTADKVRTAISEELAKRGAKTPFAVVSNPEFLKEGAAVEDFMRPDRVVVGSDDPQATQTMRALYAPFQRNHERLLVMDVRLAERLGADIEEVRKGIGSDPRIGYQFLYAGIGYGGSCFPKDVKALIHTAAEAGAKLPVLDAVERVNTEQKRVLAAKILKRFGKLAGRRIAVWGLAFKPNTDDMREAPSRVLIEELLANGASVSAYDPIAMPAAKIALADLKGVTYADSPLAALDGADALAVVTEWKEFRSPDFQAIRARLKTPAIFDGRNLYDPEEIKRAGLEYYPVGRAVARRDG
jgi:UDPglucose 6-dehydrogenase